jgi:predicted nucleic acid-binding protein
VSEGRSAGDTAADGPFPLIAVLDSGLAAGHPHVEGLRSSGFALYADGDGFRQDPDNSDCTGHGTAVTAALYRMVPEAPVLALRLLDEDLRCSSAVLAEAIRSAAAAGAKVINLSLGSGDPAAVPILVAAIEEATAAGAICVAAAHPHGRALWPADLPVVLSAQAHRSCPLGDLFSVPGPLPRYLTHGFPRPIEGQPPTQNLYGPSFAAVHLSARVARLLRDDPSAEFGQIRAALDAQCLAEWQPANSH